MGNAGDPRVGTGRCGGWHSPPATANSTSSLPCPEVVPGRRHNSAIAPVRHRSGIGPVKAARSRQFDIDPAIGPVKAARSRQFDIDSAIGPVKTARSRQFDGTPTTSAQVDPAGGGRGRGDGAVVVVDGDVEADLVVVEQARTGVPTGTRPSARS